MEKKKFRVVKGQKNAVFFKKVFEFEVKSQCARESSSDIDAKKRERAEFFLITFQLGPKRVKLLVIERDINKLDAPELDEGLLWCTGDEN